MYRSLSGRQIVTTAMNVLLIVGNTCALLYLFAIPASGDSEGESSLDQIEAGSNDPPAGNNDE